MMTIRDDGLWHCRWSSSPVCFLPSFRVDVPATPRPRALDINACHRHEAINGVMGDHPGQRQSADRTGHPHPSPVLTSPFSSARVLGMLAPFLQDRFHAQISCSTNRKSPTPANIIRLCANTGYRFAPDRALGFEWDDKRVKRAGLDYHEFADVKRWPDYEAFLAAVAPTGLCLHHQGRTAHSAARFAPGDALLFGPESRGPAHGRSSRACHSSSGCAFPCCPRAAA